jgi:hypothetical protein
MSQNLSNFDTHDILIVRWLLEHLQNLACLFSSFLAGVLSNVSLTTAMAATNLPRPAAEAQSMTPEVCAYQFKYFVRQISPMI